MTTKEEGALLAFEIWRDSYRASDQTLSEWIERALSDPRLQPEPEAACPLPVPGKDAPEWARWIAWDHDAKACVFASKPRLAGGVETKPVYLSSRSESGRWDYLLAFTDPARAGQCVKLPEPAPERQTLTFDCDPVTAMPEAATVTVRREPGDSTNKGSERERRKPEMAAGSQSQEPAEDLRWLIEDDDGPATTYICIPETGYGLATTMDVNRALQFKTEEAARAVLTDESYVGPSREKWAVRGHIWLPNPPTDAAPEQPAPAPQEAAEGARLFMQRSGGGGEITLRFERSDGDLDSSFMRVLASRGEAEDFGVFMQGERRIELLAASPAPAPPVLPEKPVQFVQAAHGEMAEYSRGPWVRALDYDALRTAAEALAKRVNVANDATNRANAAERAALDALRHRERRDTGEVWVWEQDGENFPESLACPVMVQPEQVQKWIAAEAERDELRAKLEAAEAELEAATQRASELLAEAEGRADRAEAKLAGGEPVARDTINNCIDWLDGALMDEAAEELRVNRTKLYASPAPREPAATWRIKRRKDEAFPIWVADMTGTGSPGIGFTQSDADHIGLTRILGPDNEAEIALTVVERKR
jgi:hypothetical protein